MSLKEQTWIWVADLRGKHGGAEASLQAACSNTFPSLTELVSGRCCGAEVTGHTLVKEQRRSPTRQGAQNEEALESDSIYFYLTDGSGIFKTLLHAKHYSKCSSNINSLMAHNSLQTQVLLEQSPGYNLREVK